jgi:hypothetical protein
VIKRLRPQLRALRDEQGRELLDVPDGLLPDPETPAPPRFLPEFDNALLSHAERSRVFEGSGPAYPRGSTIGSLLVDGFVRADWKLTGSTLEIDGLHTKRGRGEVEEEGLRLLEFLMPGAEKPRVEFSPIRG